MGKRVLSEYEPVAFEYSDLSRRFGLTQGVMLVTACGPYSNLLLKKLWPVITELSFCYQRTSFERRLERDVSTR
jgi:hypothetical protein